MKPLIAILIFILTGSGFISADDDLSVRAAIEVLETSLTKRDRITAVATLRNAGGSAEPAKSVLARIVATDATGDEASYAAEALGAIGKASIPVIAELVQNGFDYSYLCATRTVSRLPSSLEADLLTALTPTLETNEGSQFDAFLVLQYFPLSTEAANRLARGLLDERPRFSKVFGALFFARRADDPILLAKIEESPLACMRYLGTRWREEWRLRDSLFYQNLRAMHVQPPLPQEEQERLRDVEAQLSVLAEAAVPEALDQLRRARGPHTAYLWLEMLRVLSDHASIPRDEAMEAIERIPRERGSAIDRVLSHTNIPTKTSSSEQVGAGQPTTRPESDSEGGDKPQPESEGRSR